MSDNGKLIEVCGLWQETSKAGVKYLSGTLGNMKLLVFANSARPHDKAPSHRLMIAPVERKDARPPGEPRAAEADWA